MARSNLRLALLEYQAQSKQCGVKIGSKGDVNILIRPITPNDAPLLLDLFHNLSRRSIYYRFFSPLKTIPPDVLDRFTHVDNEHDIALVAVEDTPLLKQQILGVARLMGYPGGKGGEIAVAVGDPWQGKGVGATLMQHLIAVAKERGFETLWGIVLAENTHMLALARKVGFQISLIPGADQYKLKINLKEISVNKNHERTIYNFDS